MNSDQLLIDKFLENHPVVAVDCIEDLSLEEITNLTEQISTEKVHLMFTHMAPFRVGKVLDQISIDKIAQVFEHLSTKIAETILQTMSKSSQERILAELPADLKNQLANRLVFNKRLVGAHIETNILTLFDYSTVEKALRELKKGVATSKPVLFVLNKEKKLVGYLDVNKLLATEGKTLIRVIMNSAEKPIIANMVIRDALDNWNDSFVELPVIKGDETFLGVVSRATLTKIGKSDGSAGKLEIKTGNALGDLYLIGLTSLLGSPDQSPKS